MPSLKPTAVGNTMRSLKPLIAELSSRRRTQLRLILILMIVAGAAEMLSLGAVLAFLALLSGPPRPDSRLGWLNDLLGAPTEAGFPVLAVVLLVATGAAATGVRLLLAWASQKFVLRVGHDLGVKIYSRVLEQPYSSHISGNTSEVLAGIEKVQLVVFGILLPAMQSVVSLVVATFIITSLFLIDYMAALIAALAIAVPYAVVSYASAGLLRSNSTILSTKQTERIKQVQEGLGGLRDIIIDQSQSVFVEEFRRLDDAYRRAQTGYIFVSNAPRYIVEFAGILLIAAMTLLVSGREGGLAAAIPMLGAMALGAQRLLPLAQQVYFGWSSLVALDDITKDVLTLLHAPQMTRTRRDKEMPVVGFSRELVLDRVSFQYAGADDLALHEINLRIERGARIGFFGETGSGKSTLFDAIMGLLEPTSGEIRVDGVPITDANVASWQAQIAHVPQSIYLADGSIAANIAFGGVSKTVDMVRVRKAAERAQIVDFIDSLPDGFRTRVGERGVRLSGGQRQRLGIARALYKRANVLILDEATSALDDKTEAAVMSSLATASRDLTLLMIAHRLPTLAGCDQLVRLADGQIRDTGTYDQMLASRGRVTVATENES